MRERGMAVLLSELLCGKNASKEKRAEIFEKVVF